MVYPARCGGWIACLVVPGGLLLVGVGTVAAYLAVTQAIPPVPGLLAAAVPLGSGGLLLWLFWGTSYEIGETELVNRLGPFCFRVPLQAIEEVASTTGFRLVVGLGLGWSLDMLHVKYRKASGRRGLAGVDLPAGQGRLPPGACRSRPRPEDRQGRPRGAMRRRRLGE